MKLTSASFQNNIFLKVIYLAEPKINLVVIKMHWFIFDINFLFATNV